MIKLKDSNQYPPKPVKDIHSEYVYIIDEFEDAGVACFNYHTRQWEDPTGTRVNVDFKWFPVPTKVKYND